MSFSGSDDLELCDVCNSMCPPDMIRPWPVAGPVFGPDGRMTGDYRDSFGICLGCIRLLVLQAPLEPRERALARRSRARWEASRRLLDQAEDVFRGAA